MSQATRATQTLDKAGIAYTLHRYAYDPSADRIGLQAAESLGVPASIVLKTLMAEVDGKPVYVVLPSDAEASMKRLAAVFGGKSAAMMKPAAAERITGYHVGGISPFGQKRLVPTAVEASALDHPYVFVNGGSAGCRFGSRPPIWSPCWRAVRHHSSPEASQLPFLCACCTATISCCLKLRHMMRCRAKT